MNETEQQNAEKQKRKRKKKMKNGNKQTIILALTSVKRANTQNNCIARSVSILLK